MSQEEESSDAYFILGESRLKATVLSASINVSEGDNHTETITVRILTPDVVLNTCLELFLGESVLKNDGLFNLILTHLGNPRPDTPEMWHVLDWARLFRLAMTIQPTILRDQPVNLDTDILYTRQGCLCTQGTTPDSPERQRIEVDLSRKNGSGSRKLKIWSDPMYAIREYFSYLRMTGSLSEEQEKLSHSNWGMLRMVAAMDGVMRVDAEDLFGCATYHPFPLILPFDEEEAWEWRCEELDSFDNYDQELDSMEKEAIIHAIEALHNELLGLPPEDRCKREKILHRLELFLENPQALSDKEKEPFEEELCTARREIYNLIWQEAYKLDLEQSAGETVPLAQMLEYEMQEVYHSTIGIMCYELYSRLRSQMTPAERRLFIALYAPSAYTANRVPALDQTVLDFIRCSSEEVMGLALFVLAGFKKIGKADLAVEFTEYWKTWLWLSNLVRSGTVDQLAKILKEAPEKRHQIMKTRVVEVSMNSEEVSRFTERLISPLESSGILQQERLQTDKYSMEDFVLQQVIGDRPTILARLVNQYTTPRQREVLFHKFLSPANTKLTQQEIATNLNISQPAVSQRLQDGLEAIKQGIRKEQEAGLVNWRDVLGL